ncbi:DNA methyltransferase [Desulfuribacillus stibiiarsenatis]|uniref:DNA (cytosine-5-)-methyltransferase n=1 Tax=Desulfuribacillus stibiiarsenatis TaxID=1390249 RepID=A0A1E5L853_9FIRM|nr:DNA cytosine methyltransferase [Desulfuribacillus stibiiarsenatis]OEH86238.1 DNA methyltransferase [Desulfuribacillus stibiiarsenatis]
MRSNEIIVDNFAGGGGASTGISLAIGRSVDIAINHDPSAISMHKANHPETEHYCEDVWDVDPVKACKGRPVALAWFSPDCKHFSKAKGGKPVDKKIRGLAWLAVKWAKAVKPRVIMLENVEEFKTWGPLKEGRPDPERKGETFQLFVKSLNKLGYKVEFQELRACDFGAPTIRKRFFMIARCDGRQIKWPEPTHGAPDSQEVQAGLLKPWRTAAEIIDWSIPCPSIFDRKKPLSENTLIRIARGIKKFIIESENPYVLDNKSLFLQHYYTHQGEEARGSSLNEPISTIPTANRFGLVCAFISKYYAGCSRSTASGLHDGLHTITARPTHSLVTAFISQQYKTSIGHKADAPLGTVTTVNKANLVTAFLLKYYGSDIGQSLNYPLHTVTTKDRFGLVTIKGMEYQIMDIGMRMLQPRELFDAQGFPKDYIIEHDNERNPINKTDQVAKCGNSVPPVFAEHLVRANLHEICIERKAG